jgi:hypothetical protein
MLTEDPRLKKSKTERDEPNVARPYTLSEDPIRAQDLQLKADPMFMLSRTDSWNPNRAMP